MIDIENATHALEQTHQAPEGLKAHELPPVVQEYIQEAVAENNVEATAARIDSVMGQVPPHALDSTPELKTLLEGMKDSIDPCYLEAAADAEQVKACAETIKSMEGTTLDEWKQLDLDGRAEVCRNIENAVAKIEHRPACKVVVDSLPERTVGHYDPSTKTITLNSDYLKSQRPEDFHKCIKTILHEGRHAYQDYNLTERQVHPSDEDIRAWRANEDGYGYLDAATYGFETYYMQPVEVDARNFAEHVTDEMQSGKGNIHYSYTQADVDYFAKQVRISSGSEQQHWLDKYNWALNHLK